MVHIILLSGGSGSRLWPLSNSTRSKQFLKVLRDSDGNPMSMVQRVFRQISRVQGEKNIVIASSKSQESSIRAQIPDGYSLVLEPERRDTAPAIMLSCSYLDLVQGASESDTVIVMPIDTFADQAYYKKIPELDRAVQSNAGNLVLLGVKPTYPSEKFGYIIPQDSGQAGDEGVQKVVRFKEKPDAETASKLIEQGSLWNCGVFAFKLGYLRDLTKKYLDVDSFDQMLSQYASLPRNSFDYEVVEKEGSIAVVPYEGIWKDLGTWNTLTEEMAEPAAGRVSLSDVDNVHVINETGLPMVVAGLKDAVVVATYDGILACSKEASAGIKKQVEAVSETRPMYEKRNWGEYRVIDSRQFTGDLDAMTKELVVKQGKQLSYQRHRKRTEVWTVAAGKGEVVLDGKTMSVRAGSVVHIEPMQMHAVRAVEDLYIIEVQLGHPLIEEDIERFGFFWDL